MKKWIFSYVTTFLISTQLIADVPSLPRDENDKIIPFTDYHKLNEHQKKEFGAFMLFYELVSSKKIGGETGLCLSYESGGNGSPDKISIGLDSKSYPTGVASLENLDKEKLENLQGLIKQIGEYLDSGCEGDLVQCKNGRSVNITGYADAQHYGGKGIRAAKNDKERAVLIEKSIQENIKLSENRAKLFSDVINKVGFVSANKVKVEGKVSPVGEFLQNGLAVPEKYLSQDQSAKTLTKDSYSVDCPERRLTVIDVIFNSQSSVVNTDKGIVTPVLKSASKKFVQRSNQSIGIQSHKAYEQLKKEGKIRSFESDADLDVIVDKIVTGAGVKNPSIISACKNHATRTVVKEHLKKIEGLSASGKNSLSTKSELDLLKIASSANRNTDPDFEVARYMRSLHDGFGGINELQKDKLLGTGSGNSGQSTSFNDCFSATAAMQLEFNESNKMAGADNSKLCQPILASSNGEIEIKFDPKELHDHSVLHIGCQACNTGFRYVPEDYMNPETGKKETQMVPVYIDREMNNGMSLTNKATPSLYNKRPITADEANKLVTNFKSLSSKVKQESDKAASDYAKIGSIKDRAEKQKINMRRNFYNQMQKFSSQYTISKDLAYCMDLEIVGNCPENKKYRLFKDDNTELKKEFLGTVGMSEEEFKTALSVFNIMVDKNFGDTQKEYLHAKIKGETNSSAIQRYENVILKGIETRDVITNWLGGEQTSDNAVIFGALKKPRYYILDNCDCSSETLVEDAQKRGHSVALDRLPSSSKKHKVGGNSCIVSMPVPPSCMVNPNEKGVADEGKKANQNIRWLGLNGQLMDKALTDMMNHMSAENKKVTLAGCEGLSPAAVAEKIVQSAECSGEMKLPQGEGLDCKK